MLRGRAVQSGHLGRHVGVTSVIESSIRSAGYHRRTPRWLAQGVRCSQSDAGKAPCDGVPAHLQQRGFILEQGHQIRRGDATARPRGRRPVSPSSRLIAKVGRPRPFAQPSPACQPHDAMMPVRRRHHQSAMSEPVLLPGQIHSDGFLHRFPLHLLTLGVTALFVLYG